MATANTISKILSLGDDALISQFLFKMGTIPGASVSSEEITLRCDQPFDPPAQVLSTYDTQHRGMKITKTGRLETTEKNFTVNLRLDQKYYLYNDFMQWKNISFTPEDGKAKPDLETRVPISIESLDGENKSVKVFNYKMCKPTSVKVTSWDPSGEDPQRLELIFIYGWLEHSPAVPGAGSL